MYPRIFLRSFFSFYVYIISFPQQTLSYISSAYKNKRENQAILLSTLPCTNTSVVFVMISSLILNVIERIPSSLQLFDVECDLWEA